MFDRFLKVASDQTAPAQPVEAGRELVDFLLEKKACCIGGPDTNWLQQFAGTPLQDQAMSLVQQDIQNEMAEKTMSSQQNSFWRNRDQLQLQKKMLELQLFQIKAAPAMPAAVPSSLENATGELAPAMTAGMPASAPATPETMKTGAVKKEAIGEALLAKGMSAAQKLNPMAAERLGSRMATLAQTAKVPHVARAAEEMALASKLPRSVVQRPPLVPVPALPAQPVIKAASVYLSELLAAGDGLGRALMKVALLKQAAEEPTDLDVQREAAQGGARQSGAILGGLGGAALGAGIGALTSKGKWRVPSAVSAAGLGGALGTVPGSAAGHVLGGYQFDKATPEEQAMMAGRGVGANAGTALGGLGGALLGAGVGGLAKGNTGALAGAAGGLLGGGIAGHVAGGLLGRRHPITLDEIKADRAAQAAEDADIVAPAVKTALDTKALTGLGTSALNYVSKNPTKALSAGGAALGAAGGALTAQGQNGQGPTIGQRLGRAVVGGTAGAGLGAVAGQGVHIGKGMVGGKTFGQSLGGHLEGGLDNLVAKARMGANSPYALGTHADLDRSMPAINHLREGITSRITNNPRLQFGAMGKGSATLPA